MKKETTSRGEVDGRKSGNECEMKREPDGGIQG